MTLRIKRPIASAVYDGRVLPEDEYVISRGPDQSPRGDSAVLSGDGDGRRRIPIDETRWIGGVATPDASSLKPICITMTRPLILVCVPLWPTPEAVLPYFKARLTGKSLPPHAHDGLKVEGDKVPYDVKYYPTPNEHGPSEEEWKRCEVLLCLQVPEQLYVELPILLQAELTRVARTSSTQVPNLKLVQLSSAGVGHVTGTPFYKSIPEESKIIVCSASGIHVVPISEHGTHCLSPFPVSRLTSFNPAVIATTMALYHNFPKFILSGAEDPPRWIRMPELGNGGFVVRELRGRTIGLLG